ncbi:MAG TPA: hypothetical protein VJZ27_04965 [Aggregatilineales bacterium]|nr:hypothetical protein [Aggregatilineales bacterium]
MRRLIKRVFQLRPGEAGIVFILGVILLGNSLAYEVSGVVAVSGFLGQVGVSNMLIVWAVDMLLIAAAAAFHSLIVDRFNRIFLLRWMTFLLGILYVMLRLMFTLDIPQWFNYALLYLIAEQQWFFFPLVFWILTNDVVEIAQSRRLFPVIAAFGFIGKFAGVSLAAISPQYLTDLQLPLEELLTFNVVVYAVVFLVISFGLHDVFIRKTTHRKESISETLSEGWDFVRNVPIFRYLTLAFVALIACETFIEYRFLVISDAKYPDAGDYQTFYSIYRLVFIVASIVVQGLLSGRLLARWGLRNTPFVLPIFTAIGLGWMLAVPNLVSSFGGVLLNKIPLYTVDESTRKGFQALIPEERRGRVSIFMDSYIYTLGALLGVSIIGVTIFIGRARDTDDAYTIYLAVGLVASALSMWALSRLRRGYDVSMMNWRLKRRQRSTNLLNKLEF